MRTGGWLILLLALGAGAALYYYEKNGLTPGVIKSTALQTVVSANGSCVMNADGTATCMADPDADPDAGTPPTPQVQTEAAYNQTTGSGTGMTIGLNTQSNDYQFYDDPSEALN
jgi:hypothetical protein